MTTRTKHSINAALSVILSSMFAQGLITGNYVVSVIIIVFAATLLGMLGLRAHRNVDERETAVAGSAAFTTLVVFSTVSVFTAFWLLVTKGQDPMYKISAFVLAYSASFTMLCFGTVYAIMNEAISNTKRSLYLLFALAIAVFFVFYGIHIF